jgi:hypothetical protein
MLISAAIFIIPRKKNGMQIELIASFQSALNQLHHSGPSYETLVASAFQQI